MAQVRVNGAAAEGQLLVGSISHFIINEVDGTDDISSFGFTAGVANKGEAVLQTIAPSCPPVLNHSVSATVLHVGVEGQPSAADVLAAIQPALTGNGANATVTAGDYTVA